MIRKAISADINRINCIYQLIHDQEEKGVVSIGWQREVYPTEDTIIEALDHDDMYVLVDNDEIVAAARINQEQVSEYKNCKWKYEASNNEVMVIHTLVVDPSKERKGYGRQFIDFYERYALSHGCKYLRMDTNEINIRARRLYKSLGFNERGIVQCNFNGIKDVNLVCLEKKLKDTIL